MHIHGHVRTLMCSLLPPDADCSGGSTANSTLLQTAGDQARLSSSFAMCFSDSCPPFSMSIVCFSLWFVFASTSSILSLLASFLLTSWPVCVYLSHMPHMQTPVGSLWAWSLEPPLPLTLCPPSLFQPHRHSERQTHCIDTLLHFLFLPLSHCPSLSVNSKPFNQAQHVLTLSTKHMLYSNTNTESGPFLFMIFLCLIDYFSSSWSMHSLVYFKQMTYWHTLPYAGKSFFSGLQDCNFRLVNNSGFCLYLLGCDWVTYQK